MEQNAENPEAAPTGNPTEPTDSELFKLAADTAAKHGAGAPGASQASDHPRRKGGRPPIHGRYSKAAGSNGKNPVPLSGRTVDPVEDSPSELEPETVPRVTVPPDLLKRFAGEFCGITETTAQGFLRAKAASSKLAGPEVSALIGSVELGEKRKELVVDLSPLVAEELGLDPSLSPTACVAAIFGFFGLSVFRAANALESAAKMQNAQPPQPAAPIAT